MKEKNYGIEFARVLSMIMVMMLHVLGKGGILSEAGLLTINGQIMLYLEYLSIVSVNIFALISGYVAINSDFKISRIINLWLQVVFFSWLILMFFGPVYNIGIKEILGALAPTIFSQYWYFNAYLILFLITPILNKGLKDLSKKHFEKIIILSFLVLSLVSSFAGADKMFVQGGYSPTWLIYMYMIGAYIRLHGIPKLLGSRKKLLFTYFSITLISLLLHNLLNIMLAKFIGVTDQVWLTRRYSFPTVLIASVVLFVYFIDMKFPKKINKVIGFVSANAFGAYLFQTHPIFFKYVLDGMFSKVADLNVIILICIVLFSSLIFFIIGVFIDKIRVRLISLSKIDITLVRVYELFVKKIQDFVFY